jgi:hypothetical protein
MAPAVLDARFRGHDDGLGQSPIKIRRHKRNAELRKPTRLGYPLQRPLRPNTSPGSIWWKFFKLTHTVLLEYRVARTEEPNLRQHVETLNQHQWHSY